MGFVWQPFGRWRAEAAPGAVGEALLNMAIMSEQNKNKQMTILHLEAFWFSGLEFQPMIDIDIYAHTLNNANHAGDGSKKR